ncbi:hypothetical protein ACWKWN_03215 [Microbacterium trichothecenolyticum]
MAKIDLAGKLSDVRARVAADVPPAESPVPMFAQLSRKDARLRGDQLTALTALADAVMRRRRFKAERITENTLIRVGVDLLLAHAEQLRGSTEDELRNSVTSALANLRVCASTGTATCDSTCGDDLTPQADQAPVSPQSGTSRFPDSETSAAVLATREVRR